MRRLELLHAAFLATSKRTQCSGIDSGVSMTAVNQPMWIGMLQASCILLPAFRATCVRSKIQQLYDSASLLSKGTLPQLRETEQPQDCVQSIVESSLLDYS